MIKINEKEIKVKEIDFNGYCELCDDYGFDVTKVATNPLSAIRSLHAFNTKTTVKEAGKDIEQHFINGGKIDDFEPYFTALNDCRFLTQMGKSQETEQ